jgi:hypothetical protein
MAQSAHGKGIQHTVTAAVLLDTIPLEQLGYAMHGTGTATHAVILVLLEGTQSGLAFFRGRKSGIEVLHSRFSVS